MFYVGLSICGTFRFTEKYLNVVAMGTAATSAAARPCRTSPRRKTHFLVRRAARRAAAGQSWTGSVPRDGSSPPAAQLGPTRPPGLRSPRVPVHRLLPRSSVRTVTLVMGSYLEAVVLANADFDMVMRCSSHFYFEMSLLLH